MTRMNFDKVSRRQAGRRGTPAACVACGKPVRSKDRMKRRDGQTWHKRCAEGPPTLTRRYREPADNTGICIRCGKPIRDPLAAWRTSHGTQHKTCPG